MGVFRRLFGKKEAAGQRDVVRMMEQQTNTTYMYNGRLYDSDMVRACIRPFARAIGKANAKHIRRTFKNGTEGIEVNPEPYIRFLLEEPNPLMSMQMLLEKTATQLMLNNNAFIMLVRDELGYPCELYPISCIYVEALLKEDRLYLRFTYKNGKTAVFPYEDIIHLRLDYSDNDIFGTSSVDSLTSLMESIGSVDSSLKNAIKNGGIIRWLIKYNTSMREEDIQKNVKSFVDNYLNVESETFGAAGVDAKGDIQRIEPKDYVPNSAVSLQLKQRLYSFFNTNEKIVQSSYTEDEWISYYETVIEPVIAQLAAELTRKLFTRRERGFGNKIVFENSNLTFASMNTKLALVNYIDRGVMTPNEVRSILNLEPIDGGDVPLLRKDTGKLEDGD